MITACCIWTDRPQTATRPDCSNCSVRHTDPFLELLSPTNQPPSPEIAKEGHSSGQVYTSKITLLPYIDFRVLAEMVAQFQIPSNQFFYPGSNPNNYSIDDPLHPPLAMNILDNDSAISVGTASANIGSKSKPSAPSSRLDTSYTESSHPQKPFPTNSEPQHHRKPLRQPHTSRTSCTRPRKYLRSSTSPR